MARFRCHLVREIHNESLVLLIWIDIFNRAGVRFQQGFIGLERNAARGGGQRVDESRRANAPRRRSRECADDEITPRCACFRRGRRLPLDQVKQRPRRAAFIEEDEDTAITNAKRDRCKCRKTACPLHQLQNTGQLTRLECIADDTVVDQNWNAGELEIRAHVRAGNEPSTQS